MQADQLARGLGGRRAGMGWIARCPAHHDRKPSLSICEADSGDILVHCHAGCDQEKVIAALQGHGLWNENSTRSLSWTARRTRFERKPDQDHARRTEAALTIWQYARPAPGTLVEAYLGSRGLSLPLPESLRFHAGLRHPSGGVWPAMVALVTNGTDNSPVGIHRTFLAHDGSGKAPVDSPKMMLGPCAGGVVPLLDAGRQIVVAEGIETALSVLQATGIATWAALSAAGIRKLVLPALPTAATVIIAADNDPVGQAAAYAAAELWYAEGRQVRIAAPPEVNTDFNDLLVGKRAGTEG